MELALILPILLLLVAATVDLGRVFYSQITITNAAREGAYEAAYQPTSFIPNGDCSKTTNRIMCRVLSEAKGSFLQIAKADVAVACAPACTAAIGNTVTVTVLGHFSLITPILAPLMGGNSVTLASSATTQIVTNPPIVAALPTPTPTPTPAPTPTPTPGPTATPAPTPTPTPTPTPACFAPTAAFTVSPTGGFKNSTIFKFTDTSLNMPVGQCSTVWSWNFGDGNGNSGSGAGTSTDQNPNYTYSKSDTNPGFTVTLAVSNWVNGTPHSSTTTKVVRVDP